MNFSSTSAQSNERTSWAKTLKAVRKELLDMVNVPSTKPVVLPSHTFNKLRFEVLNKLLIATAYMLLEL